MAEFIEETRSIDEVKEEKHNKMMQAVAWRADIIELIPRDS